ncbi:hypothetical protein RND71_030706 [Anisodus tanguticus]|uniref:Uncharacterized protein n=1 Tax=Anisodus tanguticus TaxID=243964 RepID=A0AAE1RI27_9SOLA|nr:hypothetical protein RND71_030706 [Anisodus tanguticus]
MQDQELKHQNNFRNKDTYPARVLSSGKVVGDPGRYNLVKDKRAFTMNKNSDKFIDGKTINGNVAEVVVVIHNKFDAFSNEEKKYKENEEVSYSDKKEQDYTTVVEVPEKYQDHERIEKEMVELEEDWVLESFDYKLEQPIVSPSSKWGDRVEVEQEVDDELEEGEIFHAKEQFEGVKVLEQFSSNNKVVDEVNYAEGDVLILDAKLILPTQGRNGDNNNDGACDIGYGVFT